jgi:hypothetical protein
VVPESGAPSADPICDVPNVDFIDRFERLGPTGWTVQSPTPNSVSIGSVRRCGAGGLRVDAPAAASFAQITQAVAPGVAPPSMRWSFLVRVDRMAGSSVGQVHFAALRFQNGSELFFNLEGGGATLRLWEQRSSDVRSHAALAGFAMNQWLRFDVLVRLGASGAASIQVKLGTPGAEKVVLDEGLDFAFQELQNLAFGATWASAGVDFAASYDDVLVDF